VLNFRPKVTKRAKRSRESALVSRIMRAVRSRGTVPERMLKIALRRHGYRFKSHVRDLPGNPDFVFEDRRVAVFVDGDFWHGRQWKLRNFRSLEHQFRDTNNASYWLRKISGNVRRDRRVDRQLRTAGWHVIRIWESALRDQPERCLRRIQRLLEKVT